MTLLPELASALDGVEGFLHPDEPAFLAALAAQVPAGQCIVEIGSYRGRSTIALASGARDGALVYAIDPHHEHEAGGYSFGMADNQAFMQNVSAAGLGHKIRVLNIPSAFGVWDVQGIDKIGLVFIDGAHGYETVAYDVKYFGEGLQNGSILAIHDSAGTWTEPTRVADELAASPDWTEVEGCAYTRCFRKDAP